MARRIPLTMGKFALVSDEDYEKLSKYNWTAQQNGKTWYAVRKEQREGQTVQIKMHRQIMNAPNNKVVDHADNDGLNNTRKNLRLATTVQNNMNRGPLKGEYKGVFRDRHSGNRWAAEIWYMGKKRRLGHFDTPKEAAKRYDEEALKLYGEHAHLNFPKG